MLPSRNSVGAAASAPPSRKASDPFHAYTNLLPHWRNEGATYFVTWHLPPWQSDLDGPERDLMAQVLKHFEGKRYTLFAYVVMNDHIHTLVEPCATWPLEKTVHTWKSYSANQLQRQFHRQGMVWQKDYFDRIIKSETEFTETMRYILNNPIKRWPDLQGYRWVGCGGAEAAAPTEIGRWG